MERKPKPKIDRRPTLDIPIQFPRIGEIGVRVIRHKLVPEGMDPDNEPPQRRFKRWHTLEFYANSYRDKPQPEGWRKQ